MRELDKALEQPDFEKRANAFMALVEDEIVPKYPEIGISLTNLTSDAIERHSFFKNVFWPKYSRDGEDLSNVLGVVDEVGDEADQDSMKLNRVHLAVWTYKESAIEQVGIALLEVVLASDEFRPSDIDKYSDPAFEDPIYMALADFIFSTEKS